MSKELKTKKTTSECKTIHHFVIGCFTEHEMATPSFNNKRHSNDIWCARGIFLFCYNFNVCCCHYLHVGLVVGLLRTL